VSEDVARLADEFPEWRVEERWLASVSKADVRILVAHRGEVSVSGFTAEDLARAIRQSGGDG
jgi:hypothetical protein